MLEAVIKHMELWTKFFFCKHAGFIPILAQDNRYSQTPRDQQRLVSKIAARTARLHPKDTLRMTAITARQHIKLHPSSLQQLPQQQDKRRFPGSAHRDRKSTRLNSSHVAISYAV